MTKARRRSPKAKPSAEEWPKKREPSDRQKAELAKAKERANARRPPLPLDARKSAAGNTEVGSKTTDQELYYDRLLDVTGTESEIWMNGLVSSLLNAAGERDADKASASLLEGLAFLNGLGPRDEVEAALAVQMFAMHRMAMAASQRAGAAEMRDQYRDYANISVKAMRTYVAQVEALAKLRSGGKQQVEVRYVYVDARGGQNIIGSQVAPRGGGAQPAFGHQSHTPGLTGLPFAPGVAVWGEDAEGDALPLPCREEPQTLQDARRYQPRSPEGQGERSLPYGPVHARNQGGADPDESPGPERADRSR
jgi:hypothetical protein